MTSAVEARNRNPKKMKNGSMTIVLQIAIDGKLHSVPVVTTYNATAKKGGTFSATIK